MLVGLDPKSFRTSSVLKLITKNLLDLPNPKRYYGGRQKNLQSSLAFGHNLETPLVSVAFGSLESLGKDQRDLVLLDVLGVENVFWNGHLPNQLVLESNQVVTRSFPPGLLDEPYFDVAVALEQSDFGVLEGRELDIELVFDENQVFGEELGIIQHLQDLGSVRTLQHETPVLVVIIVVRELEESLVLPRENDVNQLLHFDSFLRVFSQENGLVVERETSNVFAFLLAEEEEGLEAFWDWRPSQGFVVEFDGGIEG